MNSYVMIEADYDRSTVGLWCSLCQRPSVVKVPIMFITGEGVSDGGSLENCVDCEEGEEDGSFALDCG